MYADSTLSRTSPQQQFALPLRQQASSRLSHLTSKSVTRGVPVQFYGSKMIRSVAQEAGLGRFVYLKGQSGQRYIFSAIDPRRAGLYNRALFALADQKLDSVVIVDRDSVTLTAGQTLYVHLLADDGPTGDGIVADLQDTTLQIC